MVFSLAGPGSAEFKDLLSEVLRIPLFFLCYTQAPFLFLQELILQALEADCVLFHVTQQKVLRRKLLAPTSKDGGSMVHVRLDNLSNKKPGEQFLCHPEAEPTNRECYKLNLEGKLLNQGFLSGN